MRRAVLAETLSAVESANEFLTIGCDSGPNFMTPEDCTVNHNTLHIIGVCDGPRLSRIAIDFFP